jgi:plastocyanin
VRAAALAAVVCALALPAGAGAMEMDHSGGSAMVSIGFAAFAPVTTNVLAGDTIMWSNDSTRAHTVTADDGSFDSARLAGGTMFHMRFDQAGAVPYYCRLHSFMRGEVDVHRLLLDVPRDTTTAPGRPFTFAGRSALAPGTDVRVEADSGGGYSAVGATTVADDGTFKATVTPDASATFRAVSGDDASQPVSLLVLNRTVTATASTKARRATVRALVTPASPGATVVLQLRLRDRFGWWPVARAKVGRDGRATLVVPVGRKVPARVVLTLADGATQLARTRAFTVGR